MYNERNIVMLPTKEKAIYHGQPWLHGNKLHYHTGSVDGVTEQEITSGYCKPQHLYVLSDDEIKEGDWYLANKALLKNNTPVWVIRKCNKIINGWLESNSNVGQGDNPNWSKKIIATTNSSLKIVGYEPYYEFPLISLPQIPLSFIQYFVEQYNVDNIITKVMVEYEEKRIGDEHDEYFFKIPKISSDNTINIKPIKDSFDINDIYKALKDKSCLADKKSMDEWIQRNL